MPCFTHGVALAAAALALYASPALCAAADYQAATPPGGSAKKTAKASRKRMGNPAGRRSDHILIQSSTPKLSKAPTLTGFDADVEQDVLASMEKAHDTPNDKITDSQFLDKLQGPSSWTSFSFTAALNAAFLGLAALAWSRFQGPDVDDLKKSKQAAVTSCETETQATVASAEETSSDASDLLRPVTTFGDVDSTVLQLAEAVRALDVGRCESLLAKSGGRAVAARGDLCGVTALHVAADCSSSALARLLLGRGAAVNAREAWEETPLHFAARSGSTCVCEVLLSRGAELDAPNSDGASPLLLAARAGHEDVCEFLLTKGAGVGTSLTDEELPPMLSALLVRRVFRPSCANL